MNQQSMILIRSFQRNIIGKGGGKQVGDLNGSINDWFTDKEKNSQPDI